MALFDFIINAVAESFNPCFNFRQPVVDSGQAFIDVSLIAL